MNSNIERLAAILTSSSKTVFFGGAGVSTASNIPDFRSADGIFSQTLNQRFSPEELVSHSFYQNHPKEFFEFYKQKLIYPSAVPNACHTALTTLEKNNKLQAVITQNIDGLHQMAGSKNVIELHGSVHRNHCTQCHTFYGLDSILQADPIPYCIKCGGIIKPDVVLYEEALDTDTIESAIQAISSADTLIIGGTSLVVYPAASLIHYFHGSNLVLINKSTTSADRSATLVISDDIAAVFSAAMPYVAL